MNNKTTPPAGKANLDSLVRKSTLLHLLDEYIATSDGPTRVQRLSSRTCLMCVRHLDLLRVIAENYRSKAELCRKRGWADLADSCVDMAGILDRFLGKEEERVKAELAASSFVNDNGG